MLYHKGISVEIWMIKESFKLTNKKLKLINITFLVTKVLTPPPVST